MKKIILIFCIVIVYISKGYSQKESYFDRLLGHDRILQTNTVIEKDYGYFVISKTIGPDLANNKIVFNKMNKKGEIFDQSICCDFNQDSFVYLLAYENVLSYDNSGYTIFGGYGHEMREKDDLFLMKIDEKGEKIWERTFGAPSNEWCISAKPTLDNGYIFAGNTRSFKDAVFGDYYIVKTDSLGNKLWEKSIGTDQIEILGNIVVMDDGSYIVAGVKSNGPDIFTMHAIGIDSIGKVLWDRTLGGTKVFNAYISRLNKTMDGNVLFTSGVARGNNKGLEGKFVDPYMAKISPKGIVLWEKTNKIHQDTNSLYLTSIEQVDSSFIVLAEEGYFDTNYYYRSYPTISKITKNGQLIWKQKHIYDTLSNALFGNIIITSDRGILGFGYTNGKGWIRKMDSLGRYNPLIPDALFDLNVPIKKDIFTVYPNPSDGTSLTIQLKEEKNVALFELFNPVGEKISTITVTSPVLKYSVNPEKMTSGIYYVRAIDHRGVLLQTEKIILLSK